jgi:hypothetical protein
MRRALALALVISSAMPMACARELFESDPFVEPDLSGSVRIPLSASADDGTLYILRDATLELSGSAMMTLSTPAKLEQDSALTTQLPAGAYTLFLRPGYRIEQIAPNGDRREVALQLQGQNPKRFRLREVEDATVQLSFSDGERELVFGGPAPVRLTRR